MPDAAGFSVTLSLMPRTMFPGLGWQTGVMLTTASPDGDTVIQNCIGLDDTVVDELVCALAAARQS